MSRSLMNFDVQIKVLNTRRQDDIRNGVSYPTTTEITALLRELGISYYSTIYKNIVRHCMIKDKKGYHWKDTPIHIDWLKNTINLCYREKYKFKKKQPEPLLPSAPDVVLLPETCSGKSITITESNGTITIVIK